MIELGLSRTHRLLATTPLPWRAIHVAGTNGKGSVCAYVSAMLNHYNQSTLRRSTGHRPLLHGRFTSPHLVDRWDCITLNDITVDKSLFDRVEASVHQRNDIQRIGASEFELLTATAFEIFTLAEVDVGVIEVGMGGRLDATNILGTRVEAEGVKDRAISRPLPLATAITSIGLDHQNFLGDTITKIAREKAGILKQGVPAVVAADDAEALETITACASAAGVSELLCVTAVTTTRDIWVQNGGADRSDVSLAPVHPRWPNGAIAVHLIWKALHGLGRLRGCTESAKIEAMTELSCIPQRTQWPGRLQQIDLVSLTGIEGHAVLDGAHNAQSAQLLSSFARARAEGRAVHWVLAASEGKDIGQILDILVQSDDAVSAVEFGPVEGMPWVKAKVASAIRAEATSCLLYTSPSPRDRTRSRMPSSA